MKPTFIRAALLSGLSVLTAAACTRALLTRFPHRAHLAQMQCGGEGQPECLSCLSCHVETHGNFALPSEAKCASCHEDGATRWRHAQRPAVAEVPAGKRIVFSHPLHLELPQISGQCVKCHAGAVGAEGGPPLFPPMATCTGCHNHAQEFEEARCTGCHRAEDLRGLKPVTFLSHDGAWTRRHGDEARSQGALCSQCHAQSSCDGCHDASKPLGPQTRNPMAIERDFVHRFDFVSRHAIESRLQPGQCFTCHVRTECDACHTSRGVSAAVRGGASPHPPQWASGMGAFNNQHGREARRDIASCAACHDQGAASNCVRCHRVGGMGGTPHPVGWRSTEPVTSPACAACHGGGL